MLLVVLAVACIATVPLAGGRLRALAEHELHAIWTVIAAGTIQVLIVTALPGGDHGLHVALHVVSYVFVGWFLVANRRVSGMPFIALGAALNMIVIAANGGVMPAARTALRIAGIDPSSGFANSGALDHPRLLPLGDVIPIPGPWPIGNVLSIGDLLIVGGLLILLHVCCESRLATRAVRRLSAIGL